MIFVIQGTVIKKSSVNIFVEETGTEKVFKVEPVDRDSYNKGDTVSLLCEVYEEEVAGKYRKESRYLIREVRERQVFYLNGRKVYFRQSGVGTFQFIDLELEGEKASAVRIEYNDIKEKCRVIVWKDEDEPDITELPSK